MTWVTPERIVTPYRASATSMVRFWCVITSSCEDSRNWVSSVSNRPRLTSSSAASTSSIR